jgi:hypothetical protein
LPKEDPLVEDSTWATCRNQVHRLVFRQHESSSGKCEPGTILRYDLQIPAAAGQLTQVLAGLKHTFVVADATLPDMPLVFASEGCVTEKHAPSGASFKD